LVETGPYDHRLALVIAQTLARLSEVSEITVYTTDFCAYCARVKGLLKQQGLQYTEINLSRDPDGRGELVQRTGMMTFPQVLVGQELVGGYTETAAAAENGRLQELLAA